MDCSPPGSSVHGILQARILEWVAMPSSRGSSRSRDQTCIQRHTPYCWAVGEAFPLSNMFWKIGCTAQGSDPQIHVENICRKVQKNKYRDQDPERERNKHSTYWLLWIHMLVQRSSRLFLGKGLTCTPFLRENTHALWYLGNCHINYVDLSLSMH